MLHWPILAVAVFHRGTDSSTCPARDRAVPEHESVIRVAAVVLGPRSARLVLVDAHTFTKAAALWAFMRNESRILHALVVLCPFLAFFIFVLARPVCLADAA